MLKLILIVVAVILIYMVLTRGKRVGATSAKPLKNMVRCEVCGVHLPQDDSVTAEGRFFCSEAHRNERIAP